eukprot:scaffold10245_cov49-Skeletonema_menzelii.AAC.1
MEPKYLVELKESKLLGDPWENLMKLSTVEMSAPWGLLSVLLKAHGSKAPLLDSLKAAKNFPKMADSTDAK